MPLFGGGNSEAESTKETRLIIGTGGLSGVYHPPCSKNSARPFGIN